MRLPWFHTPARLTVQPRIYAIGDIHGRADLFEQMVEQIRADVATRPPRATRIIVLGDFVDRGPASAALIRLFMRLQRQRKVIVLKGNHEAIMCDALSGDLGALDLWLMHGGAATLSSFGVDPQTLDLDDARSTLRAAQKAVPRAIQKWLRRLPTHVRFGGYYFVHAGIEPGIPLEDQTDTSRLWVSDEFTSSDADHGAVIVHGHTIDESGVVVAHNRIGIDTGAYRTGLLSAVAIDGNDEWIITARGSPDQPDDTNRNRQITGTGQ